MKSIKNAGLTLIVYLLMTPIVALANLPYEVLGKVDKIAPDTQVDSPKVTDQNKKAFIGNCEFCDREKDSGDHNHKIVDQASSAPATTPVD